MRNKFLLAEEPFVFILDSLNTSSLNTFTINGNEWEFHTDSDEFEGVLSFSAVFRGIVKVPKTVEFSISALLVSATGPDGLLGSRIQRMPSASRRIEIPFGTFTRYSVPEVAMIQRVAKMAEGLNLAYTRI